MKATINALHQDATVRIEKGRAIWTCGNKEFEAVLNKRFGVPNGSHGTNAVQQLAEEAALLFGGKVLRFDNPTIQPGNPSRVY